METIQDIYNSFQCCTTLKTKSKLWDRLLAFPDEMALQEPDSEGIIDHIP